MGRLTFVLGGARSGKTRFAMNLASGTGERVVFVATAENSDPEMATRIARHQADRPVQWRTLEFTRELDVLLAPAVESGHTVLIDCLSVWISNELLLHRDWSRHDDPGTYALNEAATTEQAILQQTQRLAAWAVARSGETIIVSNEVGSGIVPAYPLGRLYRDILGRANQTIAAGSDAVFLVVAGIGVDLRLLAQQFNGQPPARHDD